MKKSVLNRATYNIPCAKIGCRRSNPMTFSVWPWALFIVMAKQGRKGNCFLSNWKGNMVSEGLKGILGIE